jgi:hypothetical protein
MASRRLGDFIVGARLSFLDLARDRAFADPEKARVPDAA